MGSISQQINFINPSDLSCISFDGKEFTSECKKRSFIGSRLKYSDLILHSFKLPSNTNSEELASIVEIKMYEEAGLDLEKKYHISYIKKELDFEENFLIEAVAVEINRASKHLKNIVHKTKYIDFLALPFLSFSTLYKNKILLPKNDIFIYIDEDDSFITLYKDGKYISSKSTTTIEEMVKNLNSIGYETTSNNLLKILTEKGLDISLYERGSGAVYNQIESEFVKIFTKINDIILYNRSIFGFENAQRIFLCTKYGKINGLDGFIQNFGFENVEVSDFNFFAQKFEKNFLDYVTLSYIYDEILCDNQSHNIDIFPREKPFYRKTVGKYIISASIILLLAIAFVSSLYYEIDRLSQKKKDLEVKLEKIEKVAKKIKQKILVLKKDIETLNKKEQEIDIKLKNINQSLNSLESIIIRKNYSSDFILKVNALLKKYNLATTKVTLSGGDSMIIDIVAEPYKRDNIAKFMESLLKEGFVGVKTDEIISDEQIYTSTIEIKK